MPFITARTSAVLDDGRKAELAHRIGRAVAHVPGKSEADTLVDVRCGCSMWLYGCDAEPVAYVDAALFGTLVDASGLTLSDMGSMDGGKDGERGQGFPGQGGPGNGSFPSFGRKG